MMQHTHIRWLGVVAIVLSIEILVWWLVPSTAAIQTAAPRSDSAEGGSAALPAHTRVAVDAGRVPAPSSHDSKSAEASRARHAALKKAIAERKGQPAAREAQPLSTHPKPSQPHAGELKDRVGGRDALVGYLNRDFMPLARECIEQAEKESPQLKGMLAIGVEVATDEQLGGVIETADPAPTNEIADRSLIECIRETTLSVIFPPGLTSGHEKFELTLRVGEHPGESLTP